MRSVAGLVVMGILVVCATVRGALVECDRAMAALAAARAEIPTSEAVARINAVEAAMRRAVSRIHYIGRRSAERDFNALMKSALKELHDNLAQASAQENRRILFQDLSPETQRALISSLTDGLLASYESMITVKGLAVSLIGPPVLHAAVKLVDDYMLPGAINAVTGLQLTSAGLGNFVAGLEVATAGALAFPLLSRLGAKVKVWASADHNSAAAGVDPHDQYLAKLSQDRVKRINDITADGRNIRAQAMGMFRDILDDSAQFTNKRDRERLVANGVVELVRGYRDVDSMDKLWVERVNLKLRNSDLRNFESYHAMLDHLEEYAETFKLPFERLEKRLDLILQPEPEWKRDRARWKQEQAALARQAGVTPITERGFAQPSSNVVPPVSEPPAVGRP